MTMKRLLVLLLAASGAFTHAAEQAYPTRPVRLISTYPPGGGNDTVARAIAQRLTEAYGQQVIVDNRPGANGVIGCEIVARSAPDGYTLLMASIASHAINPALYPKIPYDPGKDFAGVSLLGTTVNILVVHPSIPARTVKELVAYAKSSRPDVWLQRHRQLTASCGCALQERIRVGYCSCAVQRHGPDDHRPARRTDCFQLRQCDGRAAACEGEETRRTGCHLPQTAALAAGSAGDRGVFPRI